MTRTKRRQIPGFCFILPAVIYMLALSHKTLLLENIPGNIPSLEDSMNELVVDGDQRILAGTPDAKNRRAIDHGEEEISKMFLTSHFHKTGKKLEIAYKKTMNKLCKTQKE